MSSATRLSVTLLGLLLCLDATVWAKKRRLENKTSDDGSPKSSRHLLLKTAMYILVIAASVGFLFFRAQQRKRQARQGGVLLTPTGKQKKLTVMGGATLITETETNRSIPQAVLALEGNISVQEFALFLKEKMTADRLFDRYRSVVHQNHFHLLENFDPAACMREHQLKEGQSFKDFANEMTNKPLDPIKPLWEMVVVNEASTCNILWRVHHCIGDGRSMSWSFFKLTDEFVKLSKLQEAQKKAAAEKAKASKADRAGGEKTEKKKKETASSPLSSLINLLRIYWKLVSIYIIPEPRTVLKKKGGEEKRISWSVNLKVSEIKEAGRKYGATVNDVMLACVTGALRKYIAKREPTILSPSLSLRAAVPIDLRPADAIITSLGNKFSFLLIYLPVGKESILDRLKGVKRNMDSAKNSPEKFIAYLLSQISGRFPDFLMRPVLSLATRNITIAISNVRASDIPFHIAGRKVLYNIGFVPPPPTVNMGVALISVGDDMGLSLLADAKVCPDPDEFIGLIEEEFRELQKAVNA